MVFFLLHTECLFFINIFFNDKGNIFSDFIFIKEGDIVFLSTEVIYFVGLRRYLVGDTGVSLTEGV